MNYTTLLHSADSSPFSAILKSFDQNFDGGHSRNYRQKTIFYLDFASFSGDYSIEYILTRILTAIDCISIVFFLFPPKSRIIKHIFSGFYMIF